MSRLTISGDVGGKVDIKKPELSICPDSDCDQLPEMEELYSGLTEAIQELHDNETFSITVDRNNDGLPDVITGWNDIFPIYIPETWMDQIFQEILEAISCEDDESAQEGEDCDETAEEEFERLNLRIENNRFAFGPYSVHEIEDFSPIPYAVQNMKAIKYSQQTNVLKRIQTEMTMTVIEKTTMKVMMKKMTTPATSFQEAVAQTMTKTAKTIVKTIRSVIQKSSGSMMQRQDILLTSTWICPIWEKRVMLWR